MQSDGDDDEHVAAAEALELAAESLEAASPAVTPPVHDSDDRNYALTIWEPFPTVEVLRTRLNYPKVQFAIFGLETCPTTGKKHLQTFISFENQIVWNTVKRLYPEGHNIKRCYKSALANYRYCSKDNNIYLEHGIRPLGIGKRSDLDDARDYILQGMSEREYALAVTSWAAVNGYNRLKAMLEKPWNVPDRVDLQVVYLYGPTHCGKSHKARNDYGKVYVKKPGDWWCGYTGEETVLLDEFRPDHMQFSDLLKLTDRVPFPINRKGLPIRNCRPKRVLITTPFPAQDLYAGCHTEDMEQFTSRITHIRHCVTRYEGPGGRPPTVITEE